MNKDYLKYWLTLIFIVVIAIIAINFMTPTIGNVFCPIDGECPACLCSLPSDYCRISTDLPKGELVVIIPKILFAGKPNKMIAFAYSPSNYSKERIDELIRKYLHKLKIREDEAIIEKLAVFMDIEGYPRIATSFDGCSCVYGDYYNGNNKYIDPDGLTIWNMFFTPSNNRQIIDVSGGGCPPPSPNNLRFEFAHHNPNFSCPMLCPYDSGYDNLDCCRTYFDGIVEADVQTKRIIWSYWYLLLFLVLVLYLVIKGVQNIKANKTLE
ncbi:MAG TPA: hypothetical protein VJ965_02580 [Anaerolineales bacterium]|nr:hypothetical protein [Anaerolineales bacterium]